VAWCTPYVNDCVRREKNSVISRRHVSWPATACNTASFVAVMGAATSQIANTASKGGVPALSRELGVQFAKQNIRVNALCPGPVNTPLLRELVAKDLEQAQRRLVHVPMGRFAEARDSRMRRCSWPVTTRRM